jgi:hypothetical protein
VDISDGQLIRELRLALETVKDAGQEAQARVVFETLKRHNATMADLTRALKAVRERRRGELAGLAGRIGALAESQSDAQETAEAVDRFLRSITPESGQ